MDAETEAKVLAIAQKVAWGYAKKIHVDHGELLGAAWQGAKEAADKWDENKSTSGSWGAFVGWRAQMRIADYLRSLLPSNAKRNTEMRHHEISLSGNVDEHGNQLDVIRDPRPDHETIVDLIEFRKVLGQRGEFIVSRRLQGYTLKEIAKELGISESRCSQVFTDTAKQFSTDHRFVELFGWIGPPAARSCRLRSG